MNELFNSGIARWCLVPYFDLNDLKSVASVSTQMSALVREPLIGKRYYNLDKLGDVDPSLVRKIRLPKPSSDQIKLVPRWVTHLSLGEISQPDQSIRLSKNELPPGLLKLECWWSPIISSLPDGLQTLVLSTIPSAKDLQLLPITITSLHIETCNVDILPRDLHRGLEHIHISHIFSERLYLPNTVATADLNFKYELPTQGDIPSTIQGLTIAFDIRGGNQECHYKLNFGTRVGPSRKNWCRTTRYWHGRKTEYTSFLSAEETREAVRRSFSLNMFRVIPNFEPGPVYSTIKAILN